MSNRLIVYTSNLGYTPKTMDDVISFAKETPKFYIANVELNSYLANVKVGDNIITKKGNSLYVIKAFDKCIDDLCADDANYVDTLAREYNLKKQNITSVANIVKFETWCKVASPLINKSNTKSNTMTNNSIKGFSNRLKEMFMPTEATDVRIATDGNICVATKDGYVAIDANNNLTSYPEELTIGLPVFVMCKPVEQLKVGDVIAKDRSYCKVTKIAGDKINAISYTGNGTILHTIKDILFNQTMVRVVVSLAGNIGGQMNPLMLLALNGDNKKDSLLPLMMMSQNNGALAANPMLMFALMGDGDTSTKDLLLMSAMSGGNFNFFGNAVAPAAPAAPVVTDNE